MRRVVGQAQDEDDRSQSYASKPMEHRGRGPRQIPEGDSLQLDQLHALAGGPTKSLQSGLSEMTQAPAAMQQLATMLINSKHADMPTTGPALQEWMATFAVAVQQARREGEQNPQAKALLASLMSLASVESPAAMQTQSGGLRPICSGMASGEQASRGVEEKPSSLTRGSGFFLEGADAAPSNRVEKRQQPGPSGGERPHKVARTTLPNPNREMGERGGGGSSGCVIINRPEQAPWYGPNLVQHNSNPEPRRVALGGNNPRTLGSQSHSGGRPATQQFRVYSNAFQEPLPMPRWAAAKAARMQPREEATGNLSQEANRRPQLIITGSSRSKTESTAAEPGWSVPATGGGSWKQTTPAPQPQVARKPNPQPEPRSSGSGFFPQDPAPPTSRHHGEPSTTRNPLSQSTEEGGCPGVLPASILRSSSNQDLSKPALNPMEGQLAAAWLSQRYSSLGQAMSYSEANINHLMNADSNALSHVLERLQAAQQLQGAAAAQGGLPAAAALLPLMQLQQLAQSIGSSTNMDSTQLTQPPHAHTQGEASAKSSAFSSLDTCRQSLVQPPAMSGPIPVLDKGLLPAWTDVQLGGASGSHRASFSALGPLQNNGSTLQQPKAMRPEVDHRTSSEYQQPGVFGDPRASPLYTPAPMLGARGSGRSPLVNLPTELSVSTYSHSESASREMVSLPSLDSTMTGPPAIDVNNPFEVHREHLVHTTPMEVGEFQQGFVRPSLQRPRPVRVGVEPRGSVLGPNRRTPTAPQSGDLRSSVEASAEGKSPSPLPDPIRRGPPQGDEELAAETLLNLFGPATSERLGGNRDSPSDLRRPIKKRFRSRR